MATKNDQLTARTAPLAVGDGAPDFTLLDQDRKEWKLSDAVKQGDVVRVRHGNTFKVPTSLPGLMNILK